MRPEGDNSTRMVVGAGDKIKTYLKHMDPESDKNESLHLVSDDSIVFKTCLQNISSTDKSSLVDAAEITKDGVLKLAKIPQVDGKELVTREEYNELARRLAVLEAKN